MTVASGESKRQATGAEPAPVQREGDRELNLDVESYDLNATLSVSYRVTSKRGRQFRIWATNTPHELVRELVTTAKPNTTIVWTVKESVRAKLRVLVKRILKRHGYPPDKAEQATATVLEQAELLSEAWV